MPAAKARKTGSGARPTAITKLSETPSRGKRNWLIYGPSGCGKTVLAGTAPNALFCTVETAGTESAKAFGSTADDMPIPTKVDLDEAFEYFRYGTGCKDFEWVILDSLSEIEETFWAHLQGDRMSQKIQEYGTVGTMIKREVERWNRLPINVIYTAQTMTLTKEDDEGDEYEYTIPSLGTRNGVVSQRIAAKTTLNGLMEVRVRKNEDNEREEQRRLYLRGTRGFLAKDRHLLAERRGYLIDPSIGAMAEKADANSRGVGGSKKKTTTKENP